MFSALIFDMDGLLTESESRWRQAELEVAAELGLGLTVKDLEKTMGVRMVEVAEIWFKEQPWSGPTPVEVAGQVVDRVIELGEKAVRMPGVDVALESAKELNIELALCSSSDKRLIDATLEQLDLVDQFKVVHSAENDEYGKPHPLPYLVTAEQLGVLPNSCLALEDSLNGCISARSAGMAVAAVPDPTAEDSYRFGFCHTVLESLNELTAAKVCQIAADHQFR